ncbi:MAG: metallophosphoesterase [Ethanoligenens sp.]
MTRVENITLRKYRLVSHDLPAAFDGTTIAFLSDIHHSRSFPLKRVKELVALTNSLRADVILLGGDYVSHSQAHIPNFFREAAALTAPLGVYGVLGNHDRKTNAALSQECMAQAGICSLDNKGYWLEKDGARIRVGGVGDLTTAEQDLSPMLAETRPDDFMVLVSHHPDYAEQLPFNLIDLMLCGHTHGGQVSVLGKWAPSYFGHTHYKLKYLTGVVKDADTTIIISNGIGTVGPPVRICAAPQIWLITLCADQRPIDG